VGVAKLALNDVRFTPESGHLAYMLKESASDPKRTLEIVDNFT